MGIFYLKIDAYQLNVIILARQSCEQKQEYIRTTCYNELIAKYKDF